MQIQVNYHFVQLQQGLLLYHSLVLKMQIESPVHFVLWQQELFFYHHVELAVHS